MAKKKSDNVDTSDETLGAETAMQTDEPMLGRAHVDEPVPDAVARLRAFEDEKLGPGAVRIDGQIERGVGSPFYEMSDEDKTRYAALERLVAAEQKVTDAHAALIAAQVAYEAAHAAAA